MYISRTDLLQSFQTYFIEPTTFPSAHSYITQLRMWFFFKHIFFQKAVLALHFCYSAHPIYHLVLSIYSYQYITAPILFSLITNSSLSHCDQFHLNYCSIIFNQLPRFSLDSSIPGNSTQFTLEIVMNKFSITLISEFSYLIHIENLFSTFRIKCRTLNLTCKSLLAIPSLFCLLPLNLYILTTRTLCSIHLKAKLYPNLGSLHMPISPPGTVFPWSLDGDFRAIHQFSAELPFPQECLRNTSP